VPDDRSLSVQASYDAVARAYDQQLRDELDGKPLDRALLDAFVELVGSGTIADVGCGPGQVTRWLAARHADVIGVDLSPDMIAIARDHAPHLSFEVGSMLQLPADVGAWAGAIGLYSIIHLTAEDLATACREFARVIGLGGWLLLAFHVESAEFSAGEVNHLTSWFGQDVDLDTRFLDPSDVMGPLQAAGFTIVARLDRQPTPDVEYPSRRCYLLAQLH
jgi:ubiquinone/menaquinone biosynthesis C-methylase UbiE